MSKKDDVISNVLNLVKTEEKIIKKVPDKESEDLNQARKNTIDIYNKAVEAAEEVMSIATQTEEAKDFTAFNALLKTALDANKTLADEARKNKEDSPKAIQNKEGVYVGSTSDLMKSLKKDG